MQTHPVWCRSAAGRNCVALNSNAIRKGVGLALIWWIVSPICTGQTLSVMPFSDTLVQDGAVVVTEHGLSASLQVEAANIAPNASVVLTLRPEQSSQFQLSFAGSDVITPERNISVVQILALNDAALDGDILRQITIAVDPNQTTDPAFLNVPEVDVDVFIVDDELPASISTSELIDNLVVPGKASSSVTRLELAGCAAVPQLISSIDDLREFPDFFIRLPNEFPGAFEDSRIYGPDVVADAIDALLTQATGLFSGFFIFNGGSDQDRAAAIDYWQNQGTSGLLGRCNAELFPVPMLSLHSLAILAMATLVLGVVALRDRQPRWEN